MGAGDMDETTVISGASRNGRKCVFRGDWEEYARRLVRASMQSEAWGPQHRANRNLRWRSIAARTDRDGGSPTGRPPRHQRDGLRDTHWVRNGTRLCPPTSCTRSCAPRPSQPALRLAPLWPMRERSKCSEDQGCMRAGSGPASPRSPGVAVPRLLRSPQPHRLPGREEGSPRRAQLASQSDPATSETVVASRQLLNLPVSRTSMRTSGSPGSRVTQYGR